MMLPRLGGWPLCLAYSWFHALGPGRHARGVSPLRRLRPGLTACGRDKRCYPRVNMVTEKVTAYWEISVRKKFYSCCASAVCLWERTLPGRCSHPARKQIKGKVPKSGTTVRSLLRRPHRRPDQLHSLRDEAQIYWIFDDFVVLRILRFIDGAQEGFRDALRRKTGHCKPQLNHVCDNKLLTFPPYE